MKRLGFTVIELLVVISIIAVLAGLLIVGIGKLQTTAKRRQTEQVLANCQAMFGDWEAYSRQSFSREAINSPMLVTADAANILTDQSFGRFGDVERLTQDLMYHLRTMPTNAAALAKLPANAITSLPSGTKLAKPTGSGTGTVYAYQFASACAITSNGVTTWYQCVQSSTAPTVPPDSAFWLSEAPVYDSTAASVLAQPIPLPLDAWGNPIIFVPYELGSGSTTPLQNGKAPAYTGELAVAGVLFQPKSPDGRPFFASAGPDGDFSLGDDNLYSFEH